MPNNGFIDTRGQQGIQQSDQGQFESLDTSQQKNLAQLTQIHPTLINEPALLSAFANQNHVTAQQAGMAAKYLDLYGGLQNYAKYSAENSPQNHPGQGFWQSLWGSARGIYNNLSDSVAPRLWGSAQGIYNNLSDSMAPQPGQSLKQQLTSGLKQDYQTYQGASNDLSSLGGQLGKAGERVALTAAELATGGIVGKNWHVGLGSNGSNDAASTIGNLFRTVGNLANPWSNTNVFMLMSHNMAFYESMAARYGWSYTIGYILPNMMIGIASDGVLSGSAAMGSVEADAAILTRAMEAAKNGRVLTDAEKEVYDAANKRQVERDLAYTSAKRQQAQVRAAMSETRFKAAKFTEYATKPGGPLLKAARMAGKPMTSLKLNALYLGTQMSVENNPTLKGLWEQTRNGIAYDAAGRPMGTSGQMIASYFGMDKGNMFFSPVSGLTDFYSKWIGTDPLGAYGKILGRARSYDGFTGKLGSWFNGLGLRSAQDVVDAASHYIRVRRAFQFMATHSAAEIIDAFRNTFVDDTVRGVKASDIVNQLGEAKTFEEVVHIFSDVAEGNGIVRNMIPTMSFYELSKFRIGNLSMGEHLASDGRVIEENAKTILKNDGVPTKPQSALSYVVDDASMRQINVFARWIHTRLRRAVMYIDEKTGAVENQVIRVGSVNAIPAIMDMLRAALLPENVVKSVGDLLLHSKDPQDYINAYRHAVYHTVSRRATAGLRDVEMNTYHTTVQDFVWEEINKLTGVDGGGENGIFIAGKNGFQLSAIASEEGVHKFAGIGENHLGQLRFPRVAELKGLSERVRGMAVQLGAGETARISHARGMEIESLLKDVEFNKAHLGGIAKSLPNLSKNSLKHLEIHGEKASEAYNTTIEQIQKDFNDIHSQKNIPVPNRFVRAYEKLRNEVIVVDGQIAAINEHNYASRLRLAGYDTNAPGSLEKVWASFPDANINNLEEILKSLYGKKTAYETALKQMDIRLSKPGQGLKDIGKTMREFADATREKAGADKLLRDGDVRFKATDKKIKELEQDLARMRFEHSVLIDGSKQKKVLEDEMLQLSAELERVYEQHRRLLASAYNGLAQKVQEMRAIKSPYIMGFQKTVDGLNRFLSRTFVPIALLSGGWALRVSASEALLNTLRYGFWPSFDAKVMTSIAKHEAYGLKLIEDEKVSEGKFVRDVVAGALLGVERTLVSGMEQGARDRMLDDFVGTIMRHNGHLPGGVHNTNDGVFNDETVRGAAEGIVYGQNRAGEPVMMPATRSAEFDTYIPGHPAYLTALTENLNFIAHDAILKPVAEHLNEIIYKTGVREVGGEANAVLMGKEEVIRAGCSQFTSPAALEKLRAELEAFSLTVVDKVPPGEVERYSRHTGRLEPSSIFARNNAHEEWAAAITEHIIESVSGGTDLVKVFHPSFIEQAVSGVVKDEYEMSKELQKIPRRNLPQHVPARGIKETSALSEGSAADFLRRVSEKGHTKVLGPMVNKLVREPIFLMEQHLAMENMRGLISKGLLDEPSAQLLADQRAMMNMIKYVHNPKDKTLWEQNMRVAAPFYFAQNQAWRRALRVARNDPGAFEKYLKLCLGVTNYVSNASVGGVPTIAIPGSQFMGIVGEGSVALSNLFGTPRIHGFSSLGFGLSADPGSVASVFLTGAEGGIAGLLGLARPSWGPLVTIPIKEGLKIFSQSFQVTAHKYLDWFLGPIAANSTVYSDFFPSTAGRNLIDAAIATSNAVGITNWQTSGLSSVENYVINNAMDNLFSDNYYKILKETNFKQINPATGKIWNKSEITTYCRAHAELEINNYLNNYQNVQAFLDNAHAAAIGMTVMKAAISLGAPVAVSLQETFSKDPEFQKILKRVKDFATATDEFSQKFPTHILDLTAHSVNTGANYPETTSAVTMLQNNPGLVNQYPNASAYLITRNSLYSPVAYQLELSMNLRQRQAPQEYMNSLLVSGGNDFYYNYLSTDPSAGGNGDVAGQNTTYTQYLNLKSAAQAYGRNSNPTWLAEFAGGKRYNIEINALKEMRSILKDPNIPNSYINKEDKSKFVDLLKQYDAAVYQVQSLKAAGENSYASQIEQTWYANVTELAKNAYWTNQSQFMTGVLRALPTK